MGTTVPLLSVAQVEGEPAVAQQSATETRQYNLASGSLDAVLNRFALQASLELSVSAELTQGKTSNGLNGRYSVTDGLQTILAGSGLVMRFTGDNSVTIESASRDGVLTLPPVTVSANQLGEITEGSNSYTPGTIATATRLVLTPRETPQSISVVTRQEMNDFNLMSIDKVMERTPGVSIVTQDSERTIYYVRGFAINTFQYDGIPMERNSGYSAGHALSDMAIYDRAEVLKGATGLLTGTGDPGATINLIRKKPTHELQGEVLAGTGRWNNYRAQVDVGGPLTSNVRGRFVTAYQQKESYLEGHERETTVFYGIIEADLTPTTLLTVGADYQDNEPTRSSWGGIPLYNTLGEFNNIRTSFNNGATWSHWDQYTRSAFVTLEQYFDNEWVAKLQVNHQINGYDAALASAAAGNPDPATGSGVRLFGPTRYDGETKSDALELYASGAFSLLGRSHELVLGLSSTRRHWDNSLDLRPLPYDQSVPDFYNWSGDAVYPDSWRNRPSNETTDQNGVYVTSRFNVRDDLKLITGMRVVNFERETLTESGLVVPYLGAVYDFNDNHSLYASYTTIFNPQTARDEDGNSLDPLDGKNYETGIKSSFFDDRLNASMALFQLDQNNFPQLTGGMTPMGQSAYRGIDGVRTRGYELEVSGELRPGWDLHAGYSRKVARQDGDKVATLTPEGQFTLSTKYALGGAWNRMTVGGGLRWQDETWSDAAHPVSGTVVHSVDSYLLVDAMASYRFTDQLLGQLNVTNLLDEEYYTIFDAYSTYTWGEPRNINLTLRYMF
jgi:outer membrane receptor for ferric coprogen and ferric-rhodotorulic acid